jgi:hypothetical protein
MGSRSRSIFPLVTSDSVSAFQPISSKMPKSGLRFIWPCSTRMIDVGH